MSNKIQPTYPILNDVNGDPLDAGFVFIGEEGKNPEVYPIAVFWDENLSIPAAQPIRTRNGFLSRNGRPGKIYIAQAGCSITVRNKKHSLVFTDLHADLGLTFIGFAKNAITTVESIADLANLEVWEGRTVTTKGFRKPTNFALAQPYKGGGIYVFNSTKSTVNNYVTIFNGWELQFENTINVHQCGLLCDGVTDETVLIKRAIAACEESTLIKNNDVIVIEGLDTYIKISDQIDINFALVGLRNLFFVISDTFKPTTFKAAINAITSDSWSDVPFRHRKNLGMTLDNVQIEGTEKTSELAAIKFSPAYTVTFFRMQINSLRTGNTKYGIVFDENCYLMTFNNYQCFGHHIPLTDMHSLGLAPRYTNMGENIRFFGGVVSNSASIMLNKFGWDCNFFGTSFDYCGSKVSDAVKLKQFTVGGAASIKFNQCHFETGNENAALLDNMFYCDYRATILIDGGSILLTATDNNCPLFFNDANSENNVRSGAKFILNNTWVYAPGVKVWANKSLYRFAPTYNSPESGLNQLMLNAKSYLFDPKFESGNILDLWSVDNLTERASRFSNLEQAISLASIDNTRCLKYVQNVGPGISRQLFLFSERKKNIHVGVKFLKIKFKEQLSSSVYLTLCFINDYASDNFGVPTDYYEQQIASITIAPDSSNTREMVYAITSAQSTHENVDMFSKMLIKINMFGMNSTNEMYITEIYSDQPDS